MSKVLFRYENVSSSTRYYRRNSLGIFLPIPRQKSCISWSDSSKVSAEIDWWYQKRYQAKSMGTTSLDESLHFLLGNTFLYLRSKIWQRNTTIINSINMNYIHSLLCPPLPVFSFLHSTQRHPTTSWRCGMGLLIMRCH